MLGHPETCPHGNPIDAAIARARPRGIPLSKIEAGAHATIYRITEEAEEDAALLSYLEARALTPGAVHCPRAVRIAGLRSRSKVPAVGQRWGSDRPRSSRRCPGRRTPRCSTACRAAERGHRPGPAHLAPDRRNPGPRIRARSPPERRLDLRRLGGRRERDDRVGVPVPARHRPELRALAPWKLTSTGHAACDAFRSAVIRRAIGGSMASAEPTWLRAWTSTSRRPR